MSHGRIDKFEINKIKSLTFFTEILKSFLDTFNKFVGINLYSKLLIIQRISSRINKHCIKDIFEFLSNP
jgi:hypothetical protein